MYSGTLIHGHAGVRTLHEIGKEAGDMFLIVNGE